MSACGASTPPPVEAVAVDPSRPLATYWLLPINHSAPVQDAAALRPQACGECHPSQYNDWRSSLHAQASSPGMLGQFAGQSPAFVQGCLLCHAPSSLQSPFAHGATGLKRQRERDFATQSLIEETTGLYASGKISLVENHAYDPAHAEHGLTCAGCHVRNGVVHGPPQGPGASPAKQKQAPHGEVVRLDFFESAQFCAECHQFTMRNAAGDKPLQNTYEEWRASPWADANMTCPRCHMPNRRHLWRGIHDPAMVQQALASEVDTRIEGDVLVVTHTLTNQGAGHALPTYVTPRLTAHLQVRDGQGAVIATSQMRLQREVVPGNPWREISDTRLMPFASRSHVVQVPSNFQGTVRSYVEVEPDHFYSGVYAKMLEHRAFAGRDLIEAAQRRAQQSAFVVHDRQHRLSGARLETP